MGESGFSKYPLSIFVVVCQKNCFFIIFIYFYDEVSNFCNRISTNRKLELQVELYVVSGTVCLPLLEFGKWKYIKNACEKLIGINIPISKTNKINKQDK